MKEGQLKLRIYENMERSHFINYLTEETHTQSMETVVWRGLPGEKRRRRRTQINFEG